MGPMPAGRALAELRRYRDAVARLLAERQAEREAGGVAACAPYAPDAPYASALGGAAAAVAAAGRG